MTTVNQLGYVTGGIATDEIETTTLAFGESKVDGFEVVWNGSNALNIDAVTAQDTINIGSSVNTDFVFHGATAGRDIQWDASANTAIVKDNAIVAVGTDSDYTVKFDGTSLKVDAAAANTAIDVGSAVNTDLILHGGTATRDVQWDASANTLNIANNAILSVGTLATPTLSISSDGTDNTVTSTGYVNVNATGASVRVGITGNNTDVEVHGATADLTWDASADLLTMGANGTVAVTTADKLTVGGVIVPQFFDVSYVVDKATYTAAANYIYIARQACKVVAINYIQVTAEGGALTIDLEKTGGVKLITAAVDTNAIAVNTVTPFGTLEADANITLAAGNYIKLTFGAAVTTAAGGLLVITLKRV
jgi:hypothetical protein